MTSKAPNQIRDRAQASHVIVSGGSRGLGASLVEGLLDQGYKVSSFSRRRTELTERLAKRDDFVFAELDILDTQKVQGFLDTAQQKLGPVFSLVNCAGVAMDGVLPMMLDDSIEKVISINLTSTLRLTRRVVRNMLLTDGPRVIINISSIIGLRGYRGLAAYAATKAGMDGMTRSLARELGDRGIRVNSIAPGYLETEMTHGLDDRQRKQIIRRTPLGRLGRPDDVLGPTLFLLSKQAEFITGQVLTVDGGITV